jgi:hypothetical protein
MLSLRNSPNCVSENDKKQSYVIVANGISTAEFLTGNKGSQRFNFWAKCCEFSGSQPSVSEKIWQQPYCHI